MGHVDIQWKQTSNQAEYGIINLLQMTGKDWKQEIDASTGIK
jgi:hypothetical protein